MTCKPPLHRENLDAQEVYMAVCDQHLIGPSGPLGLNKSVVWQTIDGFGVKDKKTVFKKVCHCYTEVRKELDNG